nr:sulfurtransferase TusA family protein [Candidatus Sigynarchaeota archaeon]
MVEMTLDTSGTVCPMPAFKTRKEVTKMVQGDTLVVTGDFLPAVENIIRVAEQGGCMVVSQSSSGDAFTIRLEKK